MEKQQKITTLERLPRQIIEKIAHNNMEAKMAVRNHWMITKRTRPQTHQEKENRRGALITLTIWYNR